ncbi:MAG TPA: flagellar basal body-associated FliL family protein [Cellvibrio sp.]|nr:flagellar basal body-associated FliL family protein [Cellvibrio sp.]
MAADKKAKAPEGEASGSKKKLIMIIGIAVLLVVVSVGGTIGALKFLSPAKSSEEAEEETASSEHGAEAAAIYYPLKPNFTVNYDVNGRQRFLQTELTFMYRDPGLLKTLELHMPAVRNSLVLLLSSQVFDDLQTVEGKEKLREAALEAVQEILAKEQEDAYARMSAKEKEAFKKEHGRDGANIEQVLFTNFVMQ